MRNAGDGNLSKAAVGSRLLKEWAGGNKAALDELMPVVYQQLLKLASICLRSERPDHTLRATALVHEAAREVSRHAGTSPGTELTVEKGD